MVNLMAVASVLLKYFIHMHLFVLFPALVMAFILNRLGGNRGMAVLPKTKYFYSHSLEVIIISKFKKKKKINERSKGI